MSFNLIEITCKWNTNFVICLWLKSSTTTRKVGHFPVAFLIIIGASIKRRPTHIRLALTKTFQHIRNIKRKLSSSGWTSHRSYLIMKWYHQSGLKRSYQQRQFLSCASTCNVVCDLQHVISQINADDVCVGCSLNIHDYGDNMPSFHSRNFAMTRALVVNCMCNTCWQHFHCLGVSLRLVITRNMMLKRVQYQLIPHVAKLQKRRIIHVTW